MMVHLRGVSQSFRTNILSQTNQDYFDKNRWENDEGSADPLRIVARRKLPQYLSMTNATLPNFSVGQIMIFPDNLK